ncbi:MAG TPA: hypothetical protein EYH54_05480 [Nautiliaceae bacterium]|nr:hypothetical protein [Nautiliaceae bacterium]
MKLLKKSNLLIPYLIMFFLFFLPLFLYELKELEKIKKERISELEHKSLLLDLEYEEIKELVLKYGNKKEFLNQTNQSN